jgi:hypothetical protein
MLEKNDLQQIQLLIRTETRTALKEELKPVKADISQIRKDIKTIVNYFDREYLELRKRVERLEEHLNLPPLP